MPSAVIVGSIMARGLSLPGKELEPVQGRGGQGPVKLCNQFAIT